MKFHEKVQELHTLIDNWYLEARKELNLTELPPSLLSNLMGSPSGRKIQDNQVVTPGLYRSLDGATDVQVLSQDMRTGLLVLEMLSAEPEQIDERFQTMSPRIFFALFEQNSSGAYQKEELVDIIRASGEQPDSVQKQHCKEREESFSWSSISATHGKMAERYTQLFDSVIKENKEDAKTDYLEFLFLAFILGARLGFSPRHDFRALYSGVFSLSDRTLESCQLTRKFYDDMMVETDYEEFKLFDPILEQAPPVLFYVVTSSKDQSGTDGVFYPKGCFLPSQSAVTQLLNKKIS